MIFAHGPAGWLSTDWVLKLRKKNPFSAKQVWWLLGIGAIGGVFPDLDLFYFHFVSAEVSHRQLATHTPLFYAVILGVIAILAWWRKKIFLQAAAAAFGIGIFSHLVTDSVAGVIMWVWPFSHQEFGVSTIPFILRSAQAEHLFLYNFLMEGIWFGVFIWVWGKKILPRISRLVWRSLAVIFVCMWSGTFIWIDLHSVHLAAGVLYADQDHDGQLNKDDSDLDGDGLEGMLDPDTNGDGIPNQTQVVDTVKNFDGVWVDPTDGGFAQIPLHMGLLSNSTLVLKAFMAAGFFWRQEMSMDFAQHPAGYVSSPQDAEFETTPENRRIFLQHQGRLTLGPELSLAKIHVADVVFFYHGEPEGVVTAVDESGVTVMRAQTGQGTHPEFVSDAELNKTFMAIGSPWAYDILLP